MKPTHKLYLIAFLLDCSINTAFTVMPFYIFDEFGGNAATSGAIAAFQTVSYAAVCLASAWFVNRTKNGLVWAIVGLSIFAPFYGVAPFIPVITIFALITVVGFAPVSLVWPALQSWIGAQPDIHERSKILSRFNVSWSIGLALGPLLAGFLYDRVSHAAPFLAVTVFVALTLILVLRLPQERFVHGEALPTDTTVPEETEWDRRSDFFLVTAWVSNLFGWMLEAVCRAVYPEHFQTLVHTDALGFLPGVTLSTTNVTTLFSWLAFSMSASRAVVFLVMGRTAWWHHRFSVLLISQVAAGLAFLVLSFTSNILIMAACFVVVGANNGICFYASVYYSIASKTNKHRRAAVHETMVGLGAGIGAMGFGLLVARLGVGLPFALTPILFGLAIMAQWLILAYRRNRSNKRLEGSVS